MDISTLETLVAQNNELLLRVYITQLFVIGVVAAVFVVLLLYNFIRKFY